MGVDTVRWVTVREFVGPAGAGPGVWGWEPVRILRQEARES